MGVPESAAQRPVRVTPVTRDRHVDEPPAAASGSAIDLRAEDPGSMTRAVANALAEVPLLPRDAAAAHLARRYAALLDEPVPLARFEEPLRVLRALVAAQEDPAAARRHLAKVEDALAAHSVASDLGPKLLAALTALGCTPAGRHPKAGTGIPVVQGRVDELRARRARRAGGD
jgi:hypothetical protein